MCVCVCVCVCLCLCMCVRMRAHLFPFFHHCELTQCTRKTRVSSKISPSVSMPPFKSSTCTVSIPPLSAAASTPPEAPLSSSCDLSPLARAQVSSVFFSCAPSVVSMGKNASEAAAKKKKQIYLGLFNLDRSLSLCASEAAGARWWWWRW